MLNTSAHRGHTLKTIRFRIPRYHGKTKTSSGAPGEKNIPV